ncbi:MAG TPA: L,D-transpeptidase [Ktedonobacterales bacterium]|nr:L,D-transpeptidase [Ktedonobacterales bacterium]
MAQLRPMRKMIQAAALALLALLVAACGLDTALPVRIATPTSPPPAEQQDIIPTPTATAVTPTTASSTVAPTVAPTAIPTATPRPQPAGVPVAPSATGRVILVSLNRQQLYAYEDGVYVFTILVETGRPELPTPTGVYSVYYKDCSDLRWQSNAKPTSTHNAYCGEHNGDGHQVVFRSPWPEGSPNWYAPTHINYALLFRDGGFYLHDAWWHQKFGSGGNVPHQLPNGEWETGSHGCIGMPTTAAEKLYRWATIGTAVYIRQGV